MSAIEKVAPKFKDVLTYDIVDLSTEGGIERYRVIRENLGKKPSCPSIIINGDLAFDTIPDLDELIARLEKEAGLV